VADEQGEKAPAARLTDEQLDAVAGGEGMIGFKPPDNSDEPKLFLGYELSLYDQQHPAKTIERTGGQKPFLP
jgi:hypothetical protein